MTLISCVVSFCIVEYAVVVRSAPGIGAWATHDEDGQRDRAPTSDARKTRVVHVNRQICRTVEDEQVSVGERARVDGLATGEREDTHFYGQMDKQS